MGDIKELLPRDKYDTERAEVLIAMGYPAVAPLLPDLVKWLQDYNWPVAEVLAPFLASVGRPLVPQVRMILTSDDMMWKYWIISRIVAESPVVFAEVEAELRQIASVGTQDEDQEQARLAAQNVLNHYE